MRRHVVPVPAGGRGQRFQCPYVLDADATVGCGGETKVAILGVVAQAFAIPARIRRARPRERRQRFGERARTGVAGWGGRIDQSKPLVSAPGVGLEQLL
jgi:hypothetical protein